MDDFDRRLINRLQHGLPLLANPWQVLAEELQRRGLFRTEYEGSTLRENLGLKRPENQYVLAQKQAQAS